MLAFRSIAKSRQAVALAGIA